MLLLCTETLPSGTNWAYELKLDGYRALAIKTSGQVRLRSRNDKDFNSRYPAIAKALMSQNGEAPLPLVMQKVGIPQDAFLGAFVQGREKGLFEVDDNPDVPVLKLTKLGRSLAG